MGLILSFDPGETTGVCVVRRERQSKLFEIVEAFEIKWAHRFDVFSTIQNYHEGNGGIEAIVAEEFRLFNNPITIQSQIHSYFPSVRILGFIELTTSILEIADLLHLQTPSMRKNVLISPEHKRYLHSRHMVDAYMHAKYYVLTNRHRDLI